MKLDIEEIKCPICGKDTRLSYDEKDVGRKILIVKCQNCGERISFTTTWVKEE